MNLHGQRKSYTTDLDFCLPHPFLLVLRARNAWCYCLYQYQAWPLWTKHIQQTAKRQQDGDALIRARLVILPGCCDVSRYQPYCVLCKCNCLITSPKMYYDLPGDLLQQAKMFILEQIEMSMMDRATQFFTCGDDT
jgi:hypothetical protein